MTEKKVESKAEAHVDVVPADKEAQKDVLPPESQEQKEPIPVEIVPRDAPPLNEAHSNETIPGGVYLAADGKTLTNCWNQRIDKNGKVLDEKPLLHGEW